MNALELLKQDHQKVKKLLTSATETEDKNEQKRLFREIRTELETHARLKVLNDDVEHHAEEEEEGKMFPKVRKAINSKELEELGQEMEEAKQKRVRRAS